MSNKNKPGVKTGGGTLTHGRMACPNCGVPMVIPFASLFSGDPIDCGGCGARLTLNRDESRTALDGLAKAQSIVEKIQGARGQ